MKELDQKLGIGYRFGKLTVAEDTGKRKNGCIVWRCACGCVGSVELDAPAISKERVQDCGCEARVKPGARRSDGQRFGKLTVLSYAGKRDGQHLWRCVCDCGCNA